MGSPWASFRDWGHSLEEWRVREQTGMRGGWVVRQDDGPADRPETTVKCKLSWKGNALCSFNLKQSNDSKPNPFMSASNPTRWPSDLENALKLDLTPSGPKSWVIRLHGRGIQSQPNPIFETSISNFPRSKTWVRWQASANWRHGSVAFQPSIKNLKTASIRTSCAPAWGNDHLMILNRHGSYIYIYRPPILNQRATLDYSNHHHSKA